MIHAANASSPLAVPLAALLQESMTTSETAQQGLRTAGLVSHRTDFPIGSIAQASLLTVTRTHRTITSHSHCVWTHSWTPSQSIGKRFLQLPRRIPYDALRRDTTDIDHSGDIVTEILDQASRAPEAALIRVRFEVEHSMEELKAAIKAVANDPHVTAVARQVGEDLSEDLSMESVNTMTTTIESSKSRYLSLFERLLGLPASDSQVRAIMFQFINASIEIVQNTEELSARFRSLAESYHYVADALSAKLIEQEQQANINATTSYKE